MSLRIGIYLLFTVLIFLFIILLSGCISDEFEEKSLNNSINGEFQEDPEDDFTGPQIEIVKGDLQPNVLIVYNSLIDGVTNSKFDSRLDYLKIGEIACGHFSKQSIKDGCNKMFVNFALKASECLKNSPIWVCNRDYFHTADLAILDLSLKDQNPNACIDLVFYNHSIEKCIISHSRFKLKDQLMSLNFTEAEFIESENQYNASKSFHMVESTGGYEPFWDFLSDDNKTIRMLSSGLYNVPGKENLTVFRVDYEVLNENYSFFELFFERGSGIINHNLKTIEPKSNYPVLAKYLLVSNLIGIEQGICLLGVSYQQLFSSIFLYEELDYQTSDRCN